MKIEINELELSEQYCPKYAAGIAAVVENIPLVEALNQVGLSVNDLLGLAPQTSISDIEAMIGSEGKKKLYEKIRDEESELYLIKKVLCAPEDFESASQAVSNENNDKFKVSRLISSCAQTIGYEQKNPGVEFYMVFGQSLNEAMAMTHPEENRIFVAYNEERFNPEMAKKADEIITAMIYDHTPESVQRMRDFHHQFAESGTEEKSYRNMDELRREIGKSLMELAKELGLLS